jgi:hypothetical protein
MIGKKNGGDLEEDILEMPAVSKKKLGCTNAQ